MSGKAWTSCPRTWIQIQRMARISLHTKPHRHSSLTQGRPANVRQRHDMAGTYLHGDIGAEYNSHCISSDGRNRVTHQLRFIRLADIAPVFAS